MRQIISYEGDVGEGSQDTSKKKTLLQLTEQDSDIIWTSVSQN